MGYQNVPGDSFKRYSSKSCKGSQGVRGKKSNCALFMENVTICFKPVNSCYIYFCGACKLYWCC